MANFKLTQTKEQIQADLNLLDNNSATAGQVLTANGTGGASWQNASGGSGGVSIGGGYTITSSLNSTGGEIRILCGKHTYQGNQSGEEDYFGLHKVTIDTNLSYSHTFENAVMFFIVAGNINYWTYNNQIIVDSDGNHPTQLSYNKPYFFVSDGYFDYDA